MVRLASGLLAIGIAIGCGALSGCGSDSGSATVNTSTARGTLIYDPPFRIASLNAADFGAQLGASSNGPALLALAGAPTCGIDFYHVQYNTVGGAGEVTTASGGLMIPTGSAPGCSGPRPIVLYAHGTATDKTTNMADITVLQSGATLSGTIGVELPVVAAVFAAHGYIVVAPNFAGYDTSSLPYHPYLNGDQQSKDMIDALTASQSALTQLGYSASGKLFITGYSAGGYVAMATHKALQAAPQPGLTVVASAPMSGPYALEAFGDAIFFGNVNLGAPEFGDLVATSYQHSYNNVAASAADIFDPAYAATAFGLLPSTTPLDSLIASGKLPQTAIFNSTPPVTGNAQLDARLAVPTSNPLFALGFGSPSLINNDYRLAYAIDAATNPDGALPDPNTGLPTAGVPLATAPQNPLRQDLKQNDMRSWIPQAPMLLCGGGQDPVVFFDLNTKTMAAYWSALPAGLINVLDVNAAPTQGNPFAPLQVAFQTEVAQLTASEGQQTVIQTYHGLVIPFCAVAVRSFFSQF